MALWKIVGFEVTPRTPWSINPLRSPPSTNSRDRKSIHTLWPCSASCSSGVVAMPDLLTQVGLHAQSALPGQAREKTRRIRLALCSGELSQPVRDGLLIAARFPPQGRPGLAGADGVRSGAVPGPRGHAGGGPERGCGLGPAAGRSFRKQGHRAEPYIAWRDSSTPFRPPSDFVAFRTGQSPANGEFPTFGDPGVSSARPRLRLAPDQRVRDGDAEAGLGVGQALVLAVVTVALRMGEDHDPVRGEGGQRVLDRERRLGLVGAPGGSDPLLLQPLDGLLLGGLGLADRLVGIRDPERDLRLAGGRRDDEHLRALDLLAEGGAQQRGVDRLGGEDEQLHRDAATPGSSGTNGASSPGETRMTTSATSSRAPPPPPPSTPAPPTSPPRPSPAPAPPPALDHLPLDPARDRRSAAPAAARDEAGELLGAE